jgi:hypothetical protein
MQSINDDTRICGTIPRCLNIKFTYNASRIFLVTRGWKSQALTEAIKMWIWLINNDFELYKQIKENIKQNTYEKSSFLE